MFGKNITINRHLSDFSIKLVTFKGSVDRSTIENIIFSHKTLLQNTAVSVCRKCVPVIIRGIPPAYNLSKPTDFVRTDDNVHGLRPVNGSWNWAWTGAVHDWLKSHLVLYFRKWVFNFHAFIQSRKYKVSRSNIIPNIDYIFNTCVLTLDPISPTLMVTYGHSLG